MDNTGRDTQEPQEPHMQDADSGGAPPDRSDGGVAQDKEPLIGFLRRMHKEQGKNKTAAKLGVDRKTIWRALDAGG